MEIYYCHSNTNHQPLLLGCRSLSSSGNETRNDLHFVHLDDGDWVKRCTPEGVVLLWWTAIKENVNFTAASHTLKRSSNSTRPS